jgi:rubrerythrin
MPDERVMEAIKTALEAEKEGLTMFLKLAKDTESITGKNMFITLALDEVGHIKHLENMASELEEQGALVGDLFAGGQHVSINKEDIKKTITDTSKAGDLDAIELGIKQEKLAIEFYSKCADEAQSDIERRIYEHLTAEEKTHLLILEAEKDSIKGSGYWVDFREFSPEG